jgi:hypothetical protein
MRYQEQDSKLSTQFGDAENRVSKLELIDLGYILS